MAFNFMTGEDEPDTVGPQASFESAPTEETQVEDLLCEAERRFAKAKYYEVLIKEPIFEGDSSPTALEVVKEIQTFSRERLSVLLGLRAAATDPASVFTAEEIDILKKMAQKLLKRPELGGIAVQPPSSPQLKRASAPQSPKPPEVKKPVSQQPKPKEAPKAKPAAKETGEVFRMPQKDGTSRTYKVVMEGDQKVYIGENGLKYLMVTNDAGEFYMKNVTRPARPKNGPQPHPPLNAMAIATIAAQQAQNALNAGAINVTGATAQGGQTAEGGGVGIAGLAAAVMAQ
jgi:hypothetical protein